MTPAMKLMMMGRRRDTLSSIIAAVFPAGSEGAIFLPSDLNSIKQDSLGTTAGVIGQPAGLLLDERYGLALGDELVTNGEFSTDTAGWTADELAAGTLPTLTALSGRLRVAMGGTGAYGVARTSFSTVAGKTYKLAFQLTVGTSGTGYVFRCGTTALGFDIINGSVASGASSGPLQYIFKATSATTHICFGLNAATVAGQYNEWDSISVKELPGSHVLQTTAASRPVPTSYGGYTGLLFDGGDDGLAGTQAGGGTTGFFFCGSLKVVGGDGASRSIFSDVGTNTGYRVRLASTNKLALGAGNGAAYTSATADDSVLAGNTVLLTTWDDGANLNAQVNRGAVVQAARPVVSAGGAGFSLFKDHNAASAFANVALFAAIYRKNGGIDDATRLRCQRWVAAQAGISI
jgi:hypothetical protein